MWFYFGGGTGSGALPRDRSGAGRRSLPPLTPLTAAEPLGASRLVSGSLVVVRSVSSRLHSAGGGFFMTPTHRLCWKHVEIKRSDTLPLFVDAVGRWKCFVGDLLTG